MYNFHEKNLEEELLQMNEELNELQERKNLLSIILNQEPVSFETIQSIKLIKKIYETYFDEDSGEIPSQERFFFEVATDQNSFIMLVDYVGTKNTVVLKYLHFCDEVYRLHHPKMSEKNVNELEQYVRKFLDESKEDTDFNIQILHAYHNVAKERSFTEEEMEEHKMAVEKIIEKNESEMLEFEKYLSD